MEESKEYTLNKEKLEKKLTKAYQINDVRKIVELKQKLIKLCSSYASTQYKKYSIEYQFVEANGVMRLKADVQETTSPKLSTEQVVEIITHNKKKVIYNDDYLYEYRGKGSTVNDDYGDDADYCIF